MEILVTGAAGYIGGSVAERLVELGHRVSGLVRTEEKADFLRARGVQPVLGELSDRAALIKASSRVDAVINAASSDHRGAVESILDALRGSNKTFLHTSGSSVVADNANGEASDQIYNEDSSWTPVAEKKDRVAIDRLILQPAQDRIRAIVICPTMIYGRGRGFNPRSVQIPLLVKQARKDGVAPYIGPGLNRWSNVHIDDVVDLYILALEHGRAGDFYFAENGEAELKTIAEQIGRLLEFNPPAESWSPEDAIRAWGHETVVSLGSNSRVRALKARQILGWAPKTDALLASIKEELGLESLAP
jgi:nucleoside-diphosphate-sugar epimerase